MIYIFGDSFGEITGKNRSEWVWPVILEKESNEHVKNYCKGGMGPITAFRTFYDKMDIIKENADKIIFLLSNPYRIPFPFLKNIYHMSDVGYWIHSNSNDIRLGSNLTMISEINDYALNYHMEAFTFKDMMHDELKKINYKNISFLKCISKLKKIKTIVFSCFNNELDEYESPSDDLYLKKHKFTELNDDFFKLYEKPLSQVTLLELKNKTEFYYHDKVPEVTCHMHKKNHRIMANIVLNHFYTGNRSEIFFENFIEDQNTERYIYQ